MRAIARSGMRTAAPAPPVVDGLDDIRTRRHRPVEARMRIRCWKHIDLARRLGKVMPGFVRRVAVGPVESAAQYRRLAFNLHDQDSAEWHERAVAAVDMLTNSGAAAPGNPGNGLHIADLGCGNMRLHGLLADRLVCPYQYRGYDLLPQDRAVEQIDLSRELPATDFDVAFCLGVLEYLDDLPGFLARLRGRQRPAVLSYALADTADPVSANERRAWGWLSDYTCREFERELERQGLAVRAFTLLNDGRTGLWLVEPFSRPAGSSAAWQPAV
jgi:hypothetical protein